MKRIRMTRTTVVEYSPNKKYYHEGATIEEIAQMDIAGMKETGDYDSTFNYNVVTEDVKYEIVGSD